MGAGLLAVKSGFILFIKSYQFPLQINTLEREREREISGSLKLSPAGHLACWIFSLVQKDSNAKEETFCGRNFFISAILCFLATRCTRKVYEHPKLL
jgi:hypothetical protein